MSTRPFVLLSGQLHNSTVRFLPYIVVRTVILLRPNRTKYRKFQKRIRGVSPRVPENIPIPALKFGSYGIFAEESIRLKANQIEAARMALQKTVGKKGLKMWVRVFPHIPVTKKPLEVRMGKGKGSVDHFVSNVRAGKLLFEYNCPNVNLARMGYRAASHKLPIPVGFVQKPRESTVS